MPISLEFRFGGNRGGDAYIGRAAATALADSLTRAASKHSGAVALMPQHALGRPPEVVPSAVEVWVAAAPWGDGYTVTAVVDSLGLMCKCQVYGYGAGRVRS